MEEDQRQERQGRTAASLTRLAIQLATRTAAIAASPVGWIAIGISVVVVATFLIVFSVGAPFFSPEEKTEASITQPTVEPEPEPTTSSPPSPNPASTSTEPRKQ